jgi:hypothetical protein
VRSTHDQEPRTTSHLTWCELKSSRAQRMRPVRASHRSRNRLALSKSDRVLLSDKAGLCSIAKTVRTVLRAACPRKYCGFLGRSAIVREPLQYAFRGVECHWRSGKSPKFTISQGSFGTQRSLVQIQSSRLHWTESPLASMSKGFLHICQRVTSTREKSNTRIPT